MSKAEALKSLVPQFLLEAKEFNTIYDVQGVEHDKLAATIKDLQAQCFISTATWGLKFWEEFLGIPVIEEKPVEFRRSVILGKIKGIGTVSVKLIKLVATSFSNAEIEVYENVAPNTFKIKFISTRGIPPNLQDVKDNIEEIKPAHLKVIYEFSYLIIKEIHNVMTLKELESTNLHKFAGGITYVE